MNGNPPFRGFGFGDRAVEVHHGWWPGPLGWTMFALQLLLILGVAWLLASLLLGRLGRRPVAATAAPATASTSSQSEALDLLHMRYARGEIDRDAYLQARADLGGDTDTATAEPGA